ncbi:hypothetical protein [Glycomyces sp. NPDC048151]|uniref:hypothetical protein n=1 Tax=Glycomyces sp. NPDC048151 TaxID=3364002 RepID=UPI00371F0FA1
MAAASGHTGSLGSAVLELTLEPPPGLKKAGYPVEALRLVLLPDARTALAYPRSGEDRAWAHRNTTGDLCLQYRRDDPALRWLPEDGLEPLITLVHKHLWFEERWRRTGAWPCEDAPHGDRATAHPIRTDRMHQERDRWTRQ